LDLTAGGFAPVGQLDDRIVQRGASQRLVLAAFVFVATDHVGVAKVAGLAGARQPHALALQQGEIADAWWADLGEIASAPVRLSISLTAGSKQASMLTCQPNLQS
jgi:hypothetical protein